MTEATRPISLRAPKIVELAAEYECGAGTIWRALNSPFEASAGL
jgi:hypothetical protein